MIARRTPHTARPAVATVTPVPEDQHADRAPLPAESGGPGPLGVHIPARVRTLVVRAGLLGTAATAGAVAVTPAVPVPVGVLVLLVLTSAGTGALVGASLDTDRTTAAERAQSGQDGPAGGEGR
ncbi:hypothetical protein SAMN05421803_15110 [Nocardiopsis flavescens]|uniref:Uncharacterized protein n=1 Tax=Nocardiopsis flavescens TaxID=758803 RepID=A0A1M6WUQ3_9ACTN|nr:hypothetical protein [Nocardiopsis flavescens]SHK97381.1 hypothetical protein SAMN05421803_15110 [Nocardiopsis flavescens]